MEDKNDPNSESLKLRGRMAISIQHQNISAAPRGKKIKQQNI